MKMFKHFQIGLVSFLLVLGSIGLGQAAFWDSKPDPRNAVLLLVDHGGVSNPDMEQYKLAMITRLAEAGKGRGLREARLEVISTSSALTVWVGDLEDLLDNKRATRLLEKTKRDPVGCAGLQASFKRINTRLKSLQVQGYNRIHVVVWSPLINTGLPCNNTKPVALPQLPIEMNFDSIFQRSSIGSLVFMAVSPYQETQWTEALQGSAEFLRGGGKTFALMGEEETISELTGGKITWLTRQ